MLFPEQKGWWKRNEDMMKEDTAERKGRGPWVLRAGVQAVGRS